MADKKTEVKNELNIADVQAMAAKILQEAHEAKEAAEKLLSEAKAKAGANIMTAEEMAEHEKYMNELVEIQLFKDSGKYKEDVFVAVNGENCLIKRGERVKIKRKFAEVIENSAHQDYETAELITRKEAEFKEASARN